MLWSTRAHHKWYGAHEIRDRDIVLVQRLGLGGATLRDGLEMSHF
jgi:hypothetical protein